MDITVSRENSLHTPIPRNSLLLFTFVTVEQGSRQDTIFLFALTATFYLTLNHWFRNHAGKHLQCIEDRKQKYKNLSREQLFAAFLKHLLISSHLTLDEIKIKKIF